MSDIKRVRDFDLAIKNGGFEKATYLAVGTCIERLHDAERALVELAAMVNKVIDSMNAMTHVAETMKTTIETINKQTKENGNG